MHDETASLVLIAVLLNALKEYSGKICDFTHDMLSYVHSD